MNTQITINLSSKDTRILDGTTSKLSQIIADAGTPIHRIEVLPVTKSDGVSVLRRKIVMNNPSDKTISKIGIFNAPSTVFFSIIVAESSKK